MCPFTTDEFGAYPCGGNMCLTNRMVFQSYGNSHPFEVHTDQGVADIDTGC